jgi:dephospho-CoA kinase
LVTTLQPLENNNTMILIGIAGKKESGKTTAAEYIRSCAPHRVHFVNFADCLKDDVAQMCGVTREFIEQNKAAFRSTLQGYGTDICRNLFGQDYLVNRWLNRCITISNGNPLAIVISSDVRFRNEAQAILQCNGFLFRINRPSNKLATDTHPSEVELDNYGVYDSIIDNDGSLEKFHRQISDALQQTIKLKLP